MSVQLHIGSLPNNTRNAPDMVGIIMAQSKKGVLNLAIDGAGLSPTAQSEYINAE